MATFAGQWGPQPFINTAGDAEPAAVVTVYLADGVTEATLYTSRTKAVTLSNPLPTGVTDGQPGLGDRGNGLFYADPGIYTLVVEADGDEVFRGPILVPADPAEALGAIPTSLVTGLDAALAARVLSADLRLTESETFMLSDQATVLSTGTKLVWRAPYALTLLAVRLFLKTPSSSGLVTVNVVENLTTVFSVKATIDATELVSTTAATPAVFSDTSIADGSAVSFVVDTAGTGAVGLGCQLFWTRT